MTATGCRAPGWKRPKRACSGLPVTGVGTNGAYALEWLGYWGPRSASTAGINYGDFGYGGNGFGGGECGWPFLFTTLP